MKRKLQIVLGLIVGVVLIWYLFRGTQWGEVYLAMRRAHLGWLGLAVVAVFASFYARVWRWKYIVRAEKQVSFRSMFSATQIGFLGNFVLPARAGEAIRALVLARLESIPFAKCFAYVALDRVTDLFGLMAVLLLAVLSFDPTGDVFLPGELQRLYSDPISAEFVRGVAISVAGVLTVLIAGFVILYVKRKLFLRITRAVLGVVSTTLAEKVAELLEHFAEGMRVFRSGRDMAKAVAFSLVTWFTFCVSYWGVLQAFHFEAPWYSPFIVLALLSVFISIPGPPGFIGPFHAAIVGALLVVMPDLNLDRARAAAIMAHLINLVPITLVGVWCLYRENLGLFELRRESQAAETELEDVDEMEVLPKSNDSAD